MIAFPETNTFAILAGHALLLTWIIWLVVVALRAKEPSESIDH